jgi:hypothetical protein
MARATLLQSWESYRPTKTQAFWVAAGAVVLTLIIGFGPAGWTTPGAASRLADDAATQARQDLAVAVCVEHFMKAGDARKRLSALRNESIYRRGELVAASGWATMPDRKEPNSAVAHICADRLGELKPPPPV